MTAFVQDKQTIERGLFDADLAPEELTQVRMGKIVKEKFPNLEEEDQEAVRQHPVAALNLVQQAKKELVGGGGDDLLNLDSQSTALIDGVRKFALSVRELDIDLIDRINPFAEAYAILAKSMNEARLKQVAAVIAARRVSMTLDEAREYAKRAKRFKEERGRLPNITAADPWEKRMAEGIAYLQRKAREAKEAGDEASAEEDVTQLVHVRSRDEIKAAEEIAQRNPCKDFAAFKPIFEKVQRELELRERETVKYGEYARVKKGDLFILEGQKVMVADVGDEFVSDYGRPDRRLRVVYDNGTESDLLVRSLAARLVQGQG